MKAYPSPIFPRALTAVLALLFVLSLALFLYSNYQAGDTAAGGLIASAALLSIPLGLLYASIGLLVTAARQRRQTGRIQPRLATFLYHAPRLAGVLIIVFVTAFSLDVFDIQATLWQKLGAFVMHSLPSIVMAVLLAVAWRREWVGALLFALASLFFLRFVIPTLISGSPGMGLGHLLLFSGPMAVIAALFWVNWKWKGEMSRAGR